MIKKSKTSKLIIDISLGVITLLWMFPVAFAIFGSMKSKKEYNLTNFWDIPNSLLFFENLKTANDQSDILVGMLNSFIYAFSGAFFAVVLALLAAYAIAHLDIKNKMFWFLFIYSGTIFPFQIYLIPVYKGFELTGLYNTRLGMVLFYTSIAVPFAMFVFRNFFNGISKEISEGAKIDGATDLQILTKLFLPISIAPVSVVFLTQFNWIWNELMFGITFTKSSTVRPIMSSISLMGKTNIPQMLSACIVASIPTILLFALLQKNFEAGFAFQDK